MLAGGWALLLFFDRRFSPAHSVSSGVSGQTRHSMLSGSSAQEIIAHKFYTLLFNPSLKVARFERHQRK